VEGTISSTVARASCFEDGGLVTCQVWMSTCFGFSNSGFEDGGLVTYQVWTSTWLGFSDSGWDTCQDWWWMWLGFEEKHAAIGTPAIGNSISTEPG
jgi:hypothetical protein